MGSSPIWHESGIAFVTSTITYMEYCVYPYRQNDQRLIAEFERLIHDMDIVVKEIDVSIAKAGAEIRAKHEYFRAMDSLQLACAVETGCDGFLTNDKQLRQFEGIEMILASDLK